MTSFSVLLKCAPFFGAVGIGLYILLSGLVPSWRDKDWKHWKVYDTDEPVSEDSWSVALGWAKPTKPIAEGEFAPKTAIRLYCGLGTFLIVIGLAGIVWIVLDQIKG